jgi:serine/threonine protein kinase
VSEQLARRWLGNIVEAFSELKAKNILHRDMKLANILLSDTNTETAVIKIADFGFARFVDESSIKSA